MGRTGLVWLLSLLGVACARDLDGTGPRPGDCTFSDPALASAAAMEATGEARPQQDVVQMVAKDVTSLEGIQCLKGLETLYLNTFNEVDLSPLTGHPALKILGVERVPLKSLSTLGGVPQLRAIFARGAGIVSLQSRNVQPALQTLDVGGTPIASLAGLGVWAPNLTRLHADGTALTSIDGVESLPRLSYLSVSETLVDDLRPLSGVAIESLSIAVTHVADLSALSRSQTLAWIDLSRTRVTSLAPLSAAPLTSLFADQAALTSIEGLQSMSRLRHARINSNAITDVAALAGVTGPSWLEIHGNPLDAAAPGIFQTLCDGGWAVDWDGGSCGNSCRFESCTLALP